MCYIVGLTGGIGSGKSTIAHLFAALGVPIIDADIVARGVVAVGSPALEKITQHFGKAILLPSGELNRPLLRERIFHHSEEKEWLNALLHPLIRQECLEQMCKLKKPYALLVAPLLIESQLHILCQSILVVDVTEEMQLLRTCKRDNQSQELIKKIIDSQIKRTERLKWANEIIENNANIEQNFCQLAKKVRDLHHYYLLKAEQLEKIARESK